MKNKKAGGAEAAELDLDDDQGVALALTESANAAAAAGESKKGDPMKELMVGRKHPLIEYISDNVAKFVMLRAPSEEYFLYGLRRNEWAIS
jgi:hypothetical protein